MDSHSGDFSNPFSVLDVSNICATCTKHLLKNRSYSLDTPIDITANVSLYQVLATQLQFKREQNGPSNLCPECFSKALLFYEFHQQYKKSVMLFNKYVEQQKALTLDATNVHEQEDAKLSIGPEEIWISDRQIKVEGEYNYLDEESFENDKMADSDSSFDGTPAFSREAAHTANLTSIPEKSKKRYEITYKHFMNWRAEQNIASFSEQVLLAYLGEQATKMQPNTLWVQYSMLQSTLNIYQNVNISEYTKLKAFLKRKSDGYKPKKSMTLSSEQILKFLSEAPDDEYLLQKVVLIFGISGGCRKSELTFLKIENVNDHENHAIVHVFDTKTKQPRSFLINGKFYAYVRKYIMLRPPDMEQYGRFFLNYQNKKCTKQPVGINKIAGVPKAIATYLCLENPALYTGHCFRRTSATILVDAGGDFIAEK